jgi:hypothetical protein
VKKSFRGIKYMKNRKSNKKVKSSKNRSIPSIVQHLEHALPVNNTMPSFDVSTSYCAKSISDNVPYTNEDEKDKLYKSNEYKFVFNIITD